MPSLDNATLFLAAAYLDVVLALLMTAFYRSQRTYPGFRDAWLGFLAQAAGLLLLTTRAMLPPLFSSLLASGLLLVSADRLWRAVQRFAGQSGKVALLDGCLYGAWVVGHAYFIYIDYRLDWRVAIFGATMGITFLRATWVSWRHIRGPLVANGRLLAGLFLCWGLANLLRGVAALLTTQDPRAELLQRNLYETALLFVMLPIPAAVAGGFLMLNARRMSGELEESLAQVQQLEGIIPICMYCKKIRDDSNSWQRLERYIMAHSSAKFSHGICPECATKHFPGL